MNSDSVFSTAGGIDQQEPKRALAARGGEALPAHQARSRAMRDRIVAAAETVFASKGYGGATIADIAAAAGCSVGVVYARFTDKRGLFLAIAIAFAERVRSALVTIEADLSVADGPALLKRFTRDSAAAFRMNRGLFRAILEAGFDTPEVMARLIDVRTEAARALERLAPSPPGQEARHQLRIQVASQMLYGFLFNGVLNPRAPAQISDDAALDELGNAIVAFLLSPQLEGPRP